MNCVSPIVHRLRSSLAYHARRRAARRAMGRGDAAGDAIFIFGLSRSGSTWLQETIGAWPGTLSLFEPIHRKVPGSAAAFTLEDVAAEGEEMSDEEAGVVRAMLRGELLTPRVLPPQPAEDVRRACVKLINCNNGLPRVVRGVRSRYTPLAIVRHPCAHVASWKRLKWDEKFGGIGESYRRLLELRSEYAEEVARLSTPVERMAAGWCLGNYVPLTVPGGDAWKMVRYEDVLADPDGVLADVFAAWGEGDVPAEVRRAVGRASRTAWRDGGGGRGGGLVARRVVGGGVPDGVRRVRAVRGGRGLRRVRGAVRRIRGVASVA